MVFVTKDVAVTVSHGQHEHVKDHSQAVVDREKVDHHATDEHLNLHAEHSQRNSLKCLVNLRKKSGKNKNYY